jgi:hypothetical protein
MNKASLSAAALFLLATTIMAETTVNGVIDANTVWNTAGSPYIVTDGNILVDTLVTLTIKPGVVVKIDDSRCILVKGSLVAEGTAADSIVFTKNGSATWARLWLQGGTNSFKFCRIEYADHSAIYDEGADSLYIGNCTIVNNLALPGQGGSGGGICFTIPSKKAVIERCTIAGNSAHEIDGNVGGMGGGIYVLGGGPVVIRENRISGNSAYYGGGICNDYGAVIINNTIIGNSAELGGGIYTHYKDPLSWNTIVGNTARRAGGGIFSGDDDSLLISHNTIANNSSVSGGAIHFNSSSNASVQCNTIIDTTDVALVFARSCGVVIRTNTITASDTVLHHSDACPIDARYNYWGTASNDTIRSKIFDYFDDFTKGIVSYKPFRSGPVTDTVPPGAPVGLKILARPAGKDSFYVITWSNPTDPSGIAEYYYKLNDKPASPFDTGGHLHGAPDTVFSPGGSLFLWLVDSCGNVDEKNVAFVNLDTSGVRHGTVQRRQLDDSPYLVLSATAPSGIYGIPARSAVTLSLFSLSGKLIKSLDAGIKERGSYSFDLHPGLFPQGVYFIELKTGRQSIAKRFHAIGATN